jgi:small subunit ribosomal protein S20
MANHPSALKAHRQSMKRRSRNRSNRSALRTALKTFAEMLDAGKLEEAKTAISQIDSKVDIAVRKGVLSKNAAARHKSRLSRHLNSAVAQSSTK